MAIHLFTIANLLGTLLVHILEDLTQL